MKQSLLFFLCLFCAPGLFALEGFDVPLKQRKVLLPRIPGVSNSRNHVACFYFDQFMVKQIDMGDIGADQLSIIPVGVNTEGPPCQKDRIPGEISIPKEGTAGWSGYFKGVKSHFVFYDADDGFNGALEFAVFDAKNGKKLFEDNAVGALGFTRSSESVIALRYERAFVGSCSIPREGKSCWNKISAEIHMNTSNYPDCAAGYLESKTELARGRCKAHNRRDAGCFEAEMKREANWDDAFSVIGYLVEVENLSHPSIKPGGDIIGCWPED